MKVDGACHCGHIRYEAEIDPAGVAICHCTDCQNGSGSAFRVNVRSAPDTFRLLAGELKYYIKTTADSGNPRAQAFCPECGTPILSTTVTDRRVHMLRVGTLRQRSGLKARSMGWCRSMLDWTASLAALQRFEKQKP